MEIMLPAFATIVIAVSSLKSFYIGSHFEIFRKFQIIDEIRIFHIQTFFDSRQCIADNHIAVPVLGNFSVLYFHIAETVIQYQCRYGCKRNLYRLLVSVYGFFIRRIICVIIMYGNFSGFSSQILRCNLISIQIISNFQGNRSFTVCFSLIVNIGSICLPGQLLSVL